MLMIISLLLFKSMKKWIAQQRTRLTSIENSVTVFHNELRSIFSRDGFSDW